jgi:hypothetical protein
MFNMQLRTIFASTVLIAYTSTCIAAGGIEVIAMSGQTAPGTTATFADPLSSELTPSISNDGEVLFAAKLNGLSSSDAGLWTKRPGDEMRLIVRSGTALAGGGGIIGAPFHAAKHTSNGIVFGALVGGHGAAFRHAGGITTTIVAPGQVAPGLVNAEFVSVRIDDISSNGTAVMIGGVQFESEVIPRGSIWAGSGSGIKILALEGQNAPGVSEPFLVVHRPQINSFGSVTFVAQYHGPSGFSGIGIWKTSGNSVQLFRDFRVPGTIVSALSNDRGDTVFSEDFTHKTHIFRASDSQLVEVPAPPTHKLSALSNDGQSAYHSDTSLLIGDENGNLTTLVSAGMPAPGLSPGTNFFRFPEPLVFDGHGRVAFVASCLCNPIPLPGLPQPYGVWATDDAGELIPILVPGQSIDVGSMGIPDMRTVSSVVINSDATRPSIGMSKMGHIVMQAQFTDNTSAILLSQQLVVPEPSLTCCIIAISLGCTLLRRTRIE